MSSSYKISREKLEPEPGFEPRTSGVLVVMSENYSPASESANNHENY